MQNVDPASATYLVILGLFLAVGYWAQARANLGRTLQFAAIWALIFVGAVGIAGMWGDISRGFYPNQTRFDDLDTVMVQRRADGHFYLDLQVNGTTVPFIVDTGATEMVLSKEDARAVGLDVDNLLFLGRANTANGVVQTASVRLDEVVLGPHRDTNVRAIVNDGPLFGSLLGMGYLQNWGRIEIENDRLTLYR